MYYEYFDVYKCLCRLKSYFNVDVKYTFNMDTELMRHSTTVSYPQNIFYDLLCKSDRSERSFLDIHSNCTNGCSSNDIMKFETSKRTMNSIYSDEANFEFRACHDWGQSWPKVVTSKNVLLAQVFFLIYQVCLVLRDTSFKLQRFDGYRHCACHPDT